MKKIFTLLLSVGLLSSAFAQSGQRHQSSQNNDRYQQAPNSAGTQYSVYNQHGYTQDNQKQDSKFIGTQEHNNKTTQWNQPSNNYGHTQDREMSNRQDGQYRDQQHFPSQYNSRKMEDYRFDDQRNDDHRNDDHARYVPQQKVSIFTLLFGRRH